MDCFGNSHIIHCAAMKTLVLHACADVQDYILHCMCCCYCLIQFSISCKTLTEKVCLGVGARVGGWTAMASGSCCYEKWPENQTLSFPNGSNCEFLYNFEFQSNRKTLKTLADWQHMYITKESNYKESVFMNELYCLESGSCQSSGSSTLPVLQFALS